MWERVGADARYSYTVTLLDTLIRREFIVPNLSNVFAMRRRGRARRGQAAAARPRYYSDSGSSSGGDSGDADSSDSDSDGDSEEEDPAALQALLRDEPGKRWPRWIRNPFIWGFEARHEPAAPLLDTAGSQGGARTRGVLCVRHAPMKLTCQPVATPVSLTRANVTWSTSPPRRRQVDGAGRASG